MIERLTSGKLILRLVEERRLDLEDVLRRAGIKAGRFRDLVVGIPPEDYEVERLAAILELPIEYLSTGLSPEQRENAERLYRYLGRIRRPDLLPKHLPAVLTQSYRGSPLMTDQAFRSLIAEDLDGSDQKTHED